VQGFLLGKPLPAKEVGQLLLPRRGKKDAA
jgi:EAL domain-containing protein (putative c-di-GMP-specific phosphodiesterase class I)